MKRAVDMIWWKGFYRKNFLMFFLIAFFFGFFAKPPYLFFSGYFIQPMLQSPPFLGATLGLLGLYWIKATMDSLKIIHGPDNKVLYILAALPGTQLFLLILRQLGLILGPVILYILVIGFHGIQTHTGLSLLLVFTTFFVWMGTAQLMLQQVLHPREKVWQRDWQTKLGDWLKGSLSYISLMSLWHHSRRLLLFIKGIVLGLLLALSLAQDWNPKAYFLCLWSIVCTQGLLFFRLRQKEDREIFLLRNLPISSGRRWIFYLGTTAFLALPELLFWVFFGPEPWQALHLLSGFMGMGMLSIAILYYKPLELATYVNYLLGLFGTGFVMLLFGLPLAWLGIGGVLFSWWIFWEEYYKWNGWSRE